jgi:hypothetical protein
MGHPAGQLPVERTCTAMRSSRLLCHRRGGIPTTDCKHIVSDLVNSGAHLTTHEQRASIDIIEDREEQFCRQVQQRQSSGVRVDRFCIIHNGGKPICVLLSRTAGTIVIQAVAVARYSCRDHAHDAT